MKFNGFIDKELIKDRTIAFEKRYFELSDEWKQHATIDTFAKKLVITDRETDLIDLKAILSIYFIHKQLKQAPDNRYDTFLASILNSPIPPENVKIISWNYDIQLELAYKNYSTLKTYEEIADMLTVYPSRLNPLRINQGHMTGFTVMKVNGTCSFKERDDNIIHLFSDFEKPSFEACIKKYLEVFEASKIGEYKSMLNFAWEKSGYSDLTDAAQFIVSNSDTIVVIGYSFPFFNRQVDREIFSLCPSNSRIYIQDTDPEGIIEKFRSVLDKVPIGIKIQTNNGNPVNDFFYLPAEL